MNNDWKILSFNNIKILYFSVDFLDGLHHWKNGQIIKSYEGSDRYGQILDQETDRFTHTSVGPGKKLTLDCDIEKQLKPSEGTSL